MTVPSQVPPAPLSSPTPAASGDATQRDAGRIVVMRACPHLAPAAHVPVLRVMDERPDARGTTCRCCDWLPACQCGGDLFCMPCSPEAGHGDPSCYWGPYHYGPKKDGGPAPSGTRPPPEAQRRNDRDPLWDAHYALLNVHRTLQDAIFERHHGAKAGGLVEAERALRWLRNRPATPGAGDAIPGLEALLTANGREPPHAPHDAQEPEPSWRYPDDSYSAARARLGLSATELKRRLGWHNGIPAGLGYYSAAKLLQMVLAALHDELASREPPPPQIAHGGNPTTTHPNTDAARAACPQCCKRCHGTRWVCEDHDAEPQSHECGGAGIPCPTCRPEPPPPPGAGGP